MNPPVALSEPEAAGAARGAALWRLAWALGCLALAGLSAWGGMGGGLRTTGAFLVAAVPGLLAQVLWVRHDGRVRVALAASWVAAVPISLLLAGGVAGPLAVWVLAPLAAALTDLGGRERALGAAASLGAAAVGLAAALSWPASPEPILSFLAAALLAGLTAAALLRGRAGDARRLQAETDARLRLEEALAAQPFMTAALDPAGRVLAAWGAAPAGLDADALQTDGLLGAAHAPDRPRLIQALAHAASGSPAEAAFAPRRAPDRQVRLHLRPLPDGRLLAAVIDTTDQQARETALEAARAEAEALHQGKSRFLAQMSHELRTPLNAVIGFSDIMRQRMFGPLPERYLEYANLIHEAGGHLLDLINDVLDMSKIEAERYELARESFDARDPAAAAVRMMQLQAHDKDIDLRAALPADPIPVEADRRALKQIVLNLLSNAVKFTPRKGSVTLSVEARGQVLEISVADTGVGVSPGDLERLGRPYEQAGDTDQRAKGTGLGLSLVRAMAELHGGRMTVESRLGEGSVFTVRLPVVVAPPRQTGQVVPFPAPAATAEKG